MSIPKYLTKNKCSFKPTPENRAMLVEIESLIHILNKPTSINDIINQALKSYLPTVIEVFRGEMKNKNNLLGLINNLEHKINTLINNKDIAIDFSELKKSSKNQEKNPIEQENEFGNNNSNDTINPNDIMGRLQI